MKENITLIVLNNHSPSAKAESDVKFWLERNPFINVQTFTVEDSLGLKKAKKDFHVADLPCLVIHEKKKKFKYYGEAIIEEVKRIHGKWVKK